MADERLLRQVLLNLIRNGLQAAVSAGTAPEITLRASADRDVVHIDVVDNGPGVRTDVYDRLFTPWATTKADGTGLGLSFCLEAMRTIGGSISYLTPRGTKHAWFQVGIPITPPSAVSSSMLATADEVPTQRTVSCQGTCVSREQDR